MDGPMNRKSPHSTGLLPLLEPLPKKKKAKRTAEPVLLGRGSKKFSGMRKKIKWPTDRLREKRKSQQFFIQLGRSLFVVRMKGWNLIELLLFAVCKSIQVCFQKRLKSDLNREQRPPLRCLKTFSTEFLNRFANFPADSDRDSNFKTKIKTFSERYQISFHCEQRQLKNIWRNTQLDF